MTLNTGEMAAEKSALSHTKKIPFCILNIQKESSYFKLFQKHKLNKLKYLKQFTPVVWVCLYIIYK